MFEYQVIVRVCISILRTSERPISSCLGKGRAREAVGFGINSKPGYYIEDGGEIIFIIIYK